MSEIDPAWVHAATTHAPIVLLPIATLFALISFFSSSASLRWTAFILLFLGFTTAIVAKETGEQAAHHTKHGAIDAHNIVVQDQVPALIADGKILRAHALLAEWTRNLYGGLFFIEAALLFLSSPRSTRWRGNWALSGGLERGLRSVWMVGALAGIVLLVLLGHYGGVLVYEYGVGVSR
jgi:uncharacterized membrane protein